jgi:hypothetical protein
MDMRLEQKFGFESSVVRLNSGKLFRPLTQGVDRWPVVIPESFRECGHRCIVLYELSENQFVLVEYQNCFRKEIKTSTKEVKRIWSSDTLPSGDYVTEVEAVTFLIKYQIEIPESLESALHEYERNEQQKVRAEMEAIGSENKYGSQAVSRFQLPPRPIEYWAGVNLIPLISNESAHEVDYRNLVRSCYFSSVHAAQAIRSLVSFSMPEEPRETNWMIEILNCFFVARKVDPERWCVSNATVPPEHVELPDLNWPRAFRKPQQQILQLHKLFKPVAPCIKTFFKGHAEWSLTVLEKEQLFDELKNILPLIEKTTAALGKTLRDAALLGPESDENNSEDAELAPYIKRALSSYELAEQGLLNEGKDKITDKNAYDWLRENGSDEYNLPKFSNWSRYVREGRKHEQLQKNKPLAGRTGRSIVDAKDI